LLEISKLLDSKSYNGKERLCFEQIFREEELKYLKDLAKNLKKWRNEILAHLDKEVALRVIIYLTHKKDLTCNFLGI
jgi:hypothetical protein